jgi:hypothetical protein
MTADTHHRPLTAETTDTHHRPLTAETATLNRTDTRWALLTTTLRHALLDHTAEVTLELQDRRILVIITSLEQLGNVLTIYSILLRKFIHQLPEVIELTTNRNNLLTDRVA